MRRRRVTRQTCASPITFLSAPYRKGATKTKMPGTALGASRNPWIQHLKASYQPKPKGSGTSEASGESCGMLAGQSRYEISCSSSKGGLDPGFQAAK